MAAVARGPVQASFYRLGAQAAASATAITGAAANIAAATRQFSRLAYAGVAGLSRGLSTATRSIQVTLATLASGASRVGSSLAVIGGAAVTAALASLRSFATHADRMGKQALRAGMSVEQFSRLVHAASLADVAEPEVLQSVQKFSVQMTKLRRGSADAASAFAALGLQANTLAQLSTHDALLAVFDALSKIEDPATRTAAAIEIFGRSGANLAPLFMAGADAIRDLEAQADALGLTVTDHAVRAAEAFNDTLALFLASVRGVAREVGSVLAPVLTQLMLAFQPLVQQFRLWIAENPRAVVAAGQLAAASLAAGAALKAMGAALSAVGSGIALLGPAAPIIAGLAAAIAGLAVVDHVTQGFGRLTSSATTLQSTIEGLRQTAVQTGQAIAAAFMAGDLELAFDILITGLKLAWLRFTAWVQGMIDRLVHTVLSSVVDAVNRVVKTLTSVVNDVSEALFGTKMAWLRDMEQMVSDFADALRGTEHIEARAEQRSRRIAATAKELERLRQRAAELQQQQAGAPALAPQPISKIREYQPITEDDLLAKPASVESAESRTAARGTFGSIAERVLAMSGWKATAQPNEQLAARSEQHLRELVRLQRLLLEAAERNGLVFG